MTAGDRDEAWEVRFPTVEDVAAEHFKWAWSEGEGELVWKVSGPGDGRPAHEEQLRRVWGRGPNSASGDVLGIATYAPSSARERAHVSIYVYFEASVPPTIAGWFQEAFPDAEIRERPRS